MSVIKNMKAELLTKQGPIVKNLHSNENFKSLVIGFREGTTLKEHAAYWPSKLTLLEGSVFFVQDEITILLSQYDSHDIELGVLHSVRASEDSICLLTQSRPSDS